VVGDARDRERANIRLQELELPVEPRGWHDDIVEAVDEHTEAIILIGHPPTVQPDRHVRTLVDALRGTSAHDVPVIVLLHDQITDLDAWRLYESGAAAVARSAPNGALISDHEIRELVPATVARAHDRGRTASAIFSGTAAIEAQARLRLGLAHERFAGIDVFVAPDGGSAEVHGSVATLADRQWVRRVLMATPGISRVDMAELTVESSDPPEVVDRALHNRIEQAIGVDTTVHWHLEHDRVVLAGALATQPDLQRLIHVLEHVPGVAEVENDIVVSPRQAELDRRKATAIHQAFEARGLSTDIRIGLIGPFVVLHGGPADDDMRRAALETALSIEGVKSVIDADGGRRPD